MTAVALLLFVTILFRVITPMAGGDSASWLVNFSPLAAIALCGAARLPRRTAIALPMLALFLSDLILNLTRYHTALFTPEMGVRYGALLLICGIGWSLRNRNLPALFAGTVVGSTTFYLITNTMSWATDPVYAKSAAGWLQAVTTGIPGVAPQSWVFFRNALLGDLFFTGLFVGCLAITAARPRHSGKVVAAVAR